MITGTSHVLTPTNSSRNGMRQPGDYPVNYLVHDGAPCLWRVVCRHHPDALTAGSDVDQARRAGLLRLRNHHDFSGRVVRGAVERDGAVTVPAHG